jgi:hypothetical protein
MDYEEALKTLTMDQLLSARAGNSVADMWKYSMICLEIERREKILNS